MSKVCEVKVAKIRQPMETGGDAVGTSTRGFNEDRCESVQSLDDYEGLKLEAWAIKEDAIEHLPELVDQLRETVESNGGTFCIADDAADANRYVREVCEDKEVERIVKSKPMTSEEIETNEDFEAADIDVVETDPGEWVLQVADESPSHIVASAIHKSRDAIAGLFNETFEPDEPLETAEELTMFAREQLGDLIEGADVGTTDVNFVTADTGTMALVIFEGNARKTAVVLDTHVAVVGVEKVIPTVRDLWSFIELIGRSGTGQDITSYTSLLTPPVESPTVDFDAPDTPLSEIETDRDLHLVLIDNGWLDMCKDDQLRETLYCIRCPACSNACANFQHVGGHAFGGETYSGDISTGWKAGVEGPDSAAELDNLCTGCSRCITAYPVEIDIPWINTVVRDRVNHGEVSEFDWFVEGLTPDEEPGGVSLQKHFSGNFETVAKAGSFLASVSDWAAGLGASRNLIERFLGIDARRELPELQCEALKDWFESRTSRVDGPVRTAVFYPDVYTNHVQVGCGKAAVRALEALGVDVVIPDVRSSGRASLSQDMAAIVEDHAHDVYAGLVEHINDGRDIVAIGPSDLAMFQSEYEKFFPEKSFERISEASYEVMEYVFGLLDNGVDVDALSVGADEEIAYHSHCQQRTPGLEGYTEAALLGLGYNVAISDVECCGMAGSSDYKSEYYELSVDVDSELRGQFQTGENGDRTVVASGTSCLEQLDSLSSRLTQHPIQLVAPRR